MEITSSWNDVASVAVSAVLMLLAVILVVRVTGLRSFAKMSSFDFAVTVATGSILGSIALTGSSLVNGVVAVSTLLAVQAAIGLGRTHWRLDALVDNTPRVLMAGPEILHENLRRARLSEADLRAKLRQAGIRSFDEIRYVVLETTGDVSVVSGEGALDTDLLEGVIDRERVTDTA